MKKLIYMLLMCVAFTACKKEETPPPSTSSSGCAGSSWKYEVILGNTVSAGTFKISYADANGGTVYDTTITGTWTKTITVQNSPYPFVSVGIGDNWAIHQPSGLQTTITIHIYKNGVLQPFYSGTPTTGAGPNVFCFQTGSCPTGSVTTCMRSAQCQ